MAQISVNSHLFAQEIAPEQVQEQSLEDLMAQLRDPTLENWEPIERKIWQKWSASGSDTLDFLLQRGRDALDVGSINDAIGHFSAAIDHDPNFAEAWNQRATAFFFSGQYGPSMNDIQQVLVLNPDHFGALTGMAMILERTDRPAEALDVVYRVLEVHPHRPDVLLAKDRLEKATAGSAL
ncbi:MAG: tetratricopeptide repeat protein [Pseudomonadota bacterium]